MKIILRLKLMPIRCYADMYIYILCMYVCTYVCMCLRMDECLYLGTYICVHNEMQVWKYVCLYSGVGRSFIFKCMYVYHTYACLYCIYGSYIHVCVCVRACVCLCILSCFSKLELEQFDVLLKL
jgi:hypothetical protein